jgi:hypothetical protein
MPPTVSRRREKAIDDALVSAPPEIQEVVKALQALRGVGKIVAVSVVAALGRLSRFAYQRLLMGYSGLVSSEHCSGNRIQRGSITNRQCAFETCHRRSRLGLPTQTVTRRLAGKTTTRAGRRNRGDCLESSVAIVTRYKNLAAKGKNKLQIVTAIGRELLGFIWAIGVRTETKFQAEQNAA